MSKTREAYLKYLSISKSKYIKIILENDKVIKMSLKPERFPHLIGVQYIPKYKKIPANEINLKILANDILDDKTINNLPKYEKSLLTRKSKAIMMDFNVNIAEYAIPVKTMTIGSKVKGDLFMVSHNATKTKYFIVTFNIDKFGISHPVSAMQTNKSDKKIHQLNTLKWSKPISIEHIKKFKDATKNKNKNKFY